MPFCCSCEKLSFILMQNLLTGCISPEWQGSLIFQVSLNYFWSSHSLLVFLKQFFLIYLKHITQLFLIHFSLLLTFSVAISLVIIAFLIILSYIFNLLYLPIFSSIHVLYTFSGNTISLLSKCKYHIKTLLLVIELMWKYGLPIIYDKGILCLSHDNELSI